MSFAESFEVAPPSAEFCQLDWTGERMVPGKCDALTELYHWQRYLFFRPWYEGRFVVDAGSGEGYGINYASIFAKSALGLEIDSLAIDHARRRYPNVEFQHCDVIQFDYSDADLVTCFEVIEHLEEPAALLRSLSRCEGAILISTPHREFHSPGNQSSDKPLNEFHTIEWTPEEFSQVIRDHFSDRNIVFFSQQDAWPGLISEGLDANARYCIAAIMPRDGTVLETPNWPTLGIAIPTFNGAENTKEAVITLSRSYPGSIQFAVVANGCDEQNRAKLQELRAMMPQQLQIVELANNTGFGVGCNAGLKVIAERGGIDYFAVSNDDVLPADDCLCELVYTMGELVRSERNPGVIGPVSNLVQGIQQVEIGSMTSYAEMIFRAEQYHRDHWNTVFETKQVRGLFMLIHPDCLNAVGGFDPRFGIGNCEDDDHNIRTRLAGFTLWIAEGAFLYHKGSQTFQRMNVNYTDLIARNVGLFERKWEIASHEEAFELTALPSSVSLKVPLETDAASTFRVRINGEDIDLIQGADTITFAGWVAHMMQNVGPTGRKELVEVVLKLAA